MPIPSFARILRPGPALILVLCLLLAGAGAARAQAPHPVPATAAQAAAAAPLTPAEARQVLDVLNDPAKRNQFITTLDRIARALPATTAPAPTAAPAPANAPAAATTAPAAAAPAAATPAAKPATPAKTVTLVPHSLGAELLVGASASLTTFSDQLVATARALTDFGQLWHWVHHDLATPEARLELIDAAWKLLVVMGLALAAEWLVFRGLRRVRAMLAGDARGAPGVVETPVPPTDPASGLAALDAAEEGAVEPPAPRRRRLRGAWSTLRRLPFVIGRLLLDLLPVIVFLAVSNLLLGTPFGNPLITRLVILALVQAYAITRVIMCIVRALVGPPSSRVRLFDISDHTAIYLVIWARRIVVVVLFGSAIANVAQLLGLYMAAHDALLKLVALIAHLFLIVVVLQSRAPVARWIRTRPGARGAVAAMRNGFAEIWQWVAIFYIVALWLVYAFEIPNGITRLVHFFLVTVAVLGLSRLVAVVALGLIDRGLRISPELAARYPGLEARADRYYPAIRGVVSGLVTLVTIFALLEVWGVEAIAWFRHGALGGRLADAIITVAVTTVLALAVWEGTNAAIDRHLARLGAGQPERAVRLRTLLPMLRTALLATICVFVGLTVLSEIGVNIAPLLAGAGVVGVALGFGSQKLVQDLITGLFLLLENAIQVGDVVTVSGLSGTVEHLSIRTIRLRALDGSVHIIPFSAVTTVTNQTRDYGFAVLDISLSVNEEPDRIADVLREIAAEMRKEERWSIAISADLDVMGVDKLLDGTWVLRARLRTTSAQRWAVTREFNRRLKYRFDALAIESPFTSHRSLSTNPPPPAAAPDAGEQTANAAQ